MPGSLDIDEGWRKSDLFSQAEAYHAVLKIIETQHIPMSCSPLLARCHAQFIAPANCCERYCYIERGRSANMNELPLTRERCMF